MNEHDEWMFEEEEQLAEELGMAREQESRKLMVPAETQDENQASLNMCRFSSLASPKTDKTAEIVMASSPLPHTQVESRKRQGLGEAENAFSRLKRRLVEEQTGGKSSFTVPTIINDDEVYDVESQDIQDILYSPPADLLLEDHDYAPVLAPVETTKRSNKFQQRPVDSGFYKSSKSFSGHQLYFSYDKFRKLQHDQQSVSVKKGFREDSLLKRSVYRLMEDVKAETISAKAQQINDNLALSLVKEYQDGEEEAKESQMLVDKYRPRSYIDLLTDEWLNQEVMMWVKQWDECVFKKTASESLAKKFRHKTDRLGRPEKKILLLSGPPGFGKTTMANVVAKQNGYNPFEINASDERAAELVNNRLMNAINSQSVFGDKKPNLVIIDEIDGALSTNSDAGFIKLLVDLATSSDMPNTKQKKAKTLLRPIICICNDLYAPALRPLRAVAQIYTFRKTAAAVMAKRLKSICDLEDMKVEKTALNYLVEKSDCDMRTCLNTLQILKGKLKLQQKIDSVSEGKKAPTISLQMMKDVPIGDKDVQKTIFNIWNSIFIESDDISNTYELIESHGDYDMIMSGCFESYLNMEFRDMDNTGMNIVKVHDYVNFFDNLMRKCYDGYDVPFNYFGSSIMSFSIYCHHIGTVSFQNKLVQFPRSDFENRQKVKLNRQIALDVINYVDPRTKSWLGNADQFSSQMISLIFRIISPTIRPINPQLMKEKEKNELEQLIKTMSSLRITFRHERTSQTGQAIMKLDPPVENLINFEGHQIDRQIMRHSHAIRQHIAQMIERELIHNSAIMRSDKISDQLITKKDVSKKEKSKKPGMKRKSTVPKEVVPKDFFGRPISAAELAAAAAVKVAEMNQYQVQFKYHDGFSNAVKRNVTIGDFLKLK